MAIKSKADKDDNGPIKTESPAPEATAVPALYLQERRTGDVASPYQSRQSYPGA
jgi:hypothetical protein